MLTQRNCFSRTIVLSVVSGRNTPRLQRERELYLYGAIWQLDFNLGACNAVKCHAIGIFFCEFCKMNKGCTVSTDIRFRVIVCGV